MAGRANVVQNKVCHVSNSMVESNKYFPMVRPRCPLDQTEESRIDNA